MAPLDSLARVSLTLTHSLTLSLSLSLSLSPSLSLSVSLSLSSSLPRPQDRPLLRRVLPPGRPREGPADMRDWLHAFLVTGCMRS